MPRTKPEAEEDATADEAEAPKKEAKKMTPEERTEAVRSARRKRLDDALKDKQFEYVGKFDAGDGERFTDPSGNKARHGHTVRDIESGEEIPVGKGTLNELKTHYQNITGIPERGQKSSDENGEESGDGDEG